MIIYFEDGMNQGHVIGLLGMEQNNPYLLAMQNCLVNDWVLPKIGHLREYGVLGIVYTLRLMKRHFIK